MLQTDFTRSLHNIVFDPMNDKYNFTLGLRYEEMGQWASAISFYLRAAEFSEDSLISYEALIRAALCIEQQRDHHFHVKTILLRAVALEPTRPEAYYHLCRSYEITKEWFECYVWACKGEALSNPWNDLYTKANYPGDYIFTYFRAIAAWWVGQYRESVSLLRSLIQRRDLDPATLQSSWSNYQRINGIPAVSIMYTEDMWEKLRWKFPGSEKIKQNYSQCYQDMFVLSMADGAKGKSFLEIGCDHPTWFNNTYLLETEFDWRGISIDINPEKTKIFAESRKSEVITGDATTLDYNELLKTYTFIHYLQVDCEPATNSYLALERILKTGVNFGVITFEHDFYIDPDTEIKAKSRKLLQSYGYELIVENISEDRFSPFEDWWINPTYCDPILKERMYCLGHPVLKADDYMLGKV